MAVAPTGSVNISTWINEKNALAAYNGLRLNRFWESWIKSDNCLNQNPYSNILSAGIVTGFVSLSLFGTFNRIEHALSPERVTAYAKGWFPDPRGPYFYAALLLIVLNAAKVFKEVKNQPPPEEKSQAQLIPSPKQPVPTGMDKFLVVVSQATPYLMIITNIAVTIIQIHRGDSSARTTLAFTLITLIDITRLKPTEYAWYRDTVLVYPVAAAALYYANNTNRFTIAFTLALNFALSRPTVQKKITEISSKIQTVTNKKNKKKSLEDRIEKLILNELENFFQETLNLFHSL
ncbi:MAG TPA: hypothetical protein VLH77_00080 [Gammaproteobacteria bacterium]|nr:hypothetical protein [Gammaproteobacteria bacterium]